MNVDLSFHNQILFLRWDLVVEPCCLWFVPFVLQSLSPYHWLPLQSVQLNLLLGSFESLLDSELMDWWTRGVMSRVVLLFDLGQSGWC